MGLKDMAKRDARIITLQAELLDHSGHVMPGLSPRQRSRLLRLINRDRKANGFTPLSLRGRGRKVTP